jgi:hypothetical protein
MIDEKRELKDVIRVPSRYTSRRRGDVLFSLQLKHAVGELGPFKVGTTISRAVSSPGFDRFGGGKS